MVLSENKVLDWAIKGYAKNFSLNTDTYLQSRHVFETISGYFGFGPSWMKCGDQSVMFDGGVTPFIMRKTITKDKNEGGTWEFVGDCYLHLWMDGAYSGHAVVDQWVPTSKTGEKREAGEAGETEEAGEASKDEKPKFLVREMFTLI